MDRTNPPDANGDRWRRAEEAFHAAAAIDPADRAAALRRLCGDDAPLLADVESLLRFHDAAESPLDGPPPGVERESPERIGGYRVISVLGEGGMGTVFLAEQESPRRTVALKRIRSGFVSRETLRRFERESFLLGRLSHPGIAQIHEAGVADTGHGPQPFFAMELVAGKPLVEWANERDMPVAARLELVARVADAVHHAHTRGVIHRDLKPGNILVDDSGQPKILDFGIARASAPDDAATLRTDAGRVVGTLPYMSPEQCSGDSEAIDVRTDVYALGAIAYELLAGRPPLDVARAPLPEAARIIRDVDPTTLSSVNRAFRGDVDTIVRKALEKDPERRYGSAAEFAADVRAHLAFRPIAARPATRTERIAKFARRNRALVASSVAAFATLAAGIAGTTWQWSSAVRERNNAHLAATDARLVAGFFESMVDSLDPRADGRTVTFLALLDRNADGVARAFSEKPLLEAEMRRAIGKAYLALGSFAKAEPHLVTALDRLRREPDADPILVADVLSLVGTLHHRRGRLDEAEAVYREALAANPEPDGAGASICLAVERNFGSLLARRGRLDEAEILLSRALERSRRASGRDSTETLEAENDFAAYLAQRGRAEEAVRRLEAIMNDLRAAHGPDDPRTMTAASNVAALLLQQGRVDLAEPLASDSLERRRRVLGESHVETYTSLLNLASVRAAEFRSAEAEALAREAVDGLTSQFGDEHESTAAALQSWGMALRLLGRRDEALAALERALAAHRAVSGALHPAALNTLATLGLVRLEKKDTDAAATLLEEAVDGFRKTIGLEESTPFKALTNLAALECERKRFDVSESLYSEAFAIAESSAANLTPSHLALLDYNFARMLHDSGRPAEALPKYESAVAAAPRLGGAGGFLEGVFRGGLGDCLVDLARYAEAEPHLVASLDVLANAPTKETERVARAHDRLARLYDAMGRESDADRHRNGAGAARD